MAPPTLVESKIESNGTKGRRFRAAPLSPTVGQLRYFGNPASTKAS